MHKLVVTLAAGTAIAAASAANATSFVGSTTGCFGNLNNTPAVSCSPGVSSSVGNLSFTQGSFAISDSNGFAGIGSGGGTDTLGYLTLTPTTGTVNYNNTPFSLMVSFTSPGAVSGTYFASLIGSVTDATAGGVHVNFSSPTINFGSGPGAFSLTVDNVSVSNSGIRTPITGYILTAVPEPATWGMMLLGFAGIGFAMRRRRQPALTQVA